MFYFVWTYGLHPPWLLIPLLGITLCLHSFVVHQWLIKGCTHTLWANLCWWSSLWVGDHIQGSGNFKVCTSFKFLLGPLGSPLWDSFLVSQKYAESLPSLSNFHFLFNFLLDHQFAAYPYQGHTSDYQSWTLPRSFPTVFFFKLTTSLIWGSLVSPSNQVSPLWQQRC